MEWNFRGRHTGILWYHVSVCVSSCMDVANAIERAKNVEKFAQQHLWPSTIRLQTDRFVKHNGKQVFEQTYNTHTHREKGGDGKGMPLWAFGAYCSNRMQWNAQKNTGNSQLLIDWSFECVLFEKCDSRPPLHLLSFLLSCLAERMNRGKDHGSIENKTKDGVWKKRDF